MRYLRNVPSMSSRAKPLTALALTLLALTACAPTVAPDTVSTPASPVATRSATPDAAADNERRTAREADIERRDARLAEAVASWPDAPPAGYAWPSSVAEMPASTGVQQSELQQPTNIYRCMWIDAAWNAYFEDDDAEASIAYATRADELWDGSVSSVAVTAPDGTVWAQNLAAANGICHSAVGDLKG
ncbi:hypothetical protein DO944_13550 [Microbacterium sp. SMR1]|nr:hypothetical protein DO944_13550 [Microbacterium sp. SMR1]